MVFATTLLLILLVVAMNVFAIRIRNKLRKKYATSTF
jgi:phosphate transport system permease protein